MDTPLLTFQVYGKPRGKARARVTRFGTYTPAETVAYETAVRERAKEVWGDREPFTGPLCVIVTAVLPVPKSWTKAKRIMALEHAIRPTVKPDFDNISKIVGDGLNGIVWFDDAQVVDGRVLKWYGTIPFLQVEVLQ